MSPKPNTAARWCVLGWAAQDRAGADRQVLAVDLAADGGQGRTQTLNIDDLAAFVEERERDDRPRWVWSDTSHWYPRLLRAGIRVTKCYDLRLSHAILKRSERVSEPSALRAAAEWDANAAGAQPPPKSTEALFEMDGDGDVRGQVPHDSDSALEEFDRQRTAILSSRAPTEPGERDAAGSLNMLLAAESAGALAAAEMHAAGVPWDAAEHDRILQEELGPRPAVGAKPQKMLNAATEVREALGDPTANLDSQPKLLRALRSAGIELQTTSHWELEEIEHPAIAPLLQYKKLARLLSANGWSWIDEWVRHGRYRPVYVPGGVITGRWASSGGGALQLPRQLRPAIRADPGWTLVSADVAQLEPRVLAAMSGDRALAAAGAGQDLYAGIVESGIVATRQEAKIAVLGALYGSTTGDSGRLVPRLRRNFPRAMSMVDAAAAEGERGGIVSTWLGRSSEAPGPEWHGLQAAASMPGATRKDEDLARRIARDFGRFTRNFIVQGSAAEWALAWIADLRLRLAEMLSVGPADAAAEAAGPAFSARPHLVFFLHDEIIVHTPERLAESVADEVRGAAARAGRLLFDDSPVDFPLDVTIARRAVKE